MPWALPVGYRVRRNAWLKTIPIGIISGFSVNTVSNAMRNKDNVKKSTKELIQKIAHDLNYIPNNIARSLVSKKSFLIALVIHSIEDPFYSELINHLEYLI